MRIIATCALVIALTGCATKPSNIKAAYVSPLKYKDYTCDQIIMEMDHVGRRVDELYVALKKRADGDAAVTGVGLILFWPVLFAIDGDGPEAQEYARLKGEYEALRQQSVAKNCDQSALPPSPDEIVESLENSPPAKLEEEPDSGE
ncbi:metal ABC transporter ATP-binding protein [Planctomycetota bacterium]|nr:metal ABC transporter ATP-binding protein [Planctomycetota bacterium]